MLFCLSCEKGQYVYQVCYSEPDYAIPHTNNYASGCYVFDEEVPKEKWFTTFILPTLSRLKYKPDTIWVEYLGYETGWAR